MILIWSKMRGFLKWIKVWNDDVRIGFKEKIGILCWKREEERCGGRRLNGGMVIEMKVEIRGCEKKWDEVEIEIERLWWEIKRGKSRIVINMGGEIIRFEISK